MKVACETSTLKTQPSKLEVGYKRLLARRVSLLMTSLITISITGVFVTVKLELIQIVYVRTLLVSLVNLANLQINHSCLQQACNPSHTHLLKSENEKLMKKI